MKRFLKDIFIEQIVLSIFIILIIKFFSQEHSSFILRYILLLILVILSIIYIVFLGTHPLDRRNDRNKFVLFVREIFLTLYLIVILAWLKILLDSLKIIINDDLIELFILLFSYRLIISILAIMIGVKFRSLLLFMIGIFPIIIVAGVFDIKWWALVTGFLTLWNYLNSKEFLIYLRRGKKLNDIPKDLKYKWATNKFVAYLVTFIVYIALIISSFFEIKNPQTVIDYLENGSKRVYSLLGVLFILSLVIFIFAYYFYLLNYKKKLGKIDKSLLSLGNKCGFNSFNTTVQFYIKAKKGELK